LRVELDKAVIEEIVEILAQELDIKHLGLEEEEVLIKLASLSIAIYLSSLRLNPDQSTKVH
jgi:hypothetical protein